MEKKHFQDIKVVAFDADDTLWDCQSHFDRVTARMGELLLPWCSATESKAELFKTESKNLSLSGYGSKAYILSVIETAIRVSGGDIAASAIGELVELGYGLMRMPVTPLPEVADTLQRMHNYYKVVFTKGDLLDQEQKLIRSGLAHHFQHLEITSDKSIREFLHLCQKLHIQPNELLMVGNSFKSDIAPALDIGANGIHIPYSVVWEMEHNEIVDGKTRTFEEFEHPRCVKIQHFSEILDLV